MDVFGSEELGVSLVALFIVFFVTTLKLLGTQVLVQFSTLLLVLSIFPSLIYMIWGLQYLKPSSWVLFMWVHLAYCSRLLMKVWKSTGQC